MNTDFNTMTLHERINLADDPSTPSEVLDRLSYDPDVNVRAWAWDSIEERGLMELLGD